MKTKNLIRLGIYITLFALLNSSCNKETEPVADASLMVTANDEAQSAALSDQIVSETDFYVNTAYLSGFKVTNSMEKVAQANGPSVNCNLKDTTNFPKTITLDFGTAGMTGKRENTVKGKLIIVISDKMWKPNSTKTITFENFYMNGNKISGTKTITYNGLNEQSQPYWTIVVKDTVTRQDGSVVIWNSNRIRTRIDNGGSPLNWNDDTYAITGSSNGINAKGKAFSMMIDPANPLIAYCNYPFFVKGIVTIVSEDKSATLNYGDGTKDNKATVTIADITKEIILRK